MRSEGRVVKVLSENALVINLGSEDGLAEHDRLLVYSLGDEIVDPETNEALGLLEIVRGRGEVRHLQARMATIQSVEKKKVLRERERRMSGALAYVVPADVVTEEVEVTAPFQGAKTGDLVRVF